MSSGNYLGGADNERASGIAVDSAGAVFLAGRTDSPNFPVVTPVRGTPAGDIDVFVNKVNRRA